MDDHGAVLHLEIEAVIFGPEAVERLPVALDFPKALVIELFQIPFRNLELIEQSELLERVEPRDLCGADFVEDDLQHGAETRRAGRALQRKSASPGAASAGI